MDKIKANLTMLIDGLSPIIHEGFSVDNYDEYINVVDKFIVNFNELNLYQHTIKASDIRYLIRRALFACYGKKENFNMNIGIDYINKSIQKLHRFRFNLETHSIDEAFNLVNS